MSDEASVLLVDAAVAIGIGLLVGLEREHSDVAAGADSPESLIGVRTFALLSLFGWVAGVVGRANPWLPVAALLVAGALVLPAALREKARGRGLTTEVAALTTLLLGMLVHRHRTVAVVLSLCTTMLLISKPWFRSFVPRLRRMDLTATLQLLVVFAIVLPLLPEEARDPWHVLSPRRIGLFVALIAAVGYVGYMLSRFLGGRRGAGLTGVVGGLVSSTAVTAAMAQQSKDAAMVGPGQLATLLASAVMLARVIVVSAFVGPSVAAQLALPLGVMGAVTLAGAVWKWRAARARSGETPELAAEPELRNPFSLVPVLKWGVFFVVVLVGSAVMRDAFGDLGLLATAALSGVMDVDAVTLAATRHASDGDLAAGMAALTITVAVVSNTIVKTGIAWVGGGRRFGADVAKVFGAATAAGLGAAILRLA